jgi:hypothetical protein
MALGSVASPFVLHSLPNRMKLIVGLLGVVSLVIASGCAKTDWIDRTLVAVDVTGSWYGAFGAGVGAGARDVLFELEQKGATVKGFMRFPTTDDIKIALAVLAGVIGLISILFNVYQYVAARRRESLSQIIQGEKETAAASAVRIRGMRRSPRRGELQALCLASVFERSGRTRSLIHGALREQQVKQSDEIRKIVDQITDVIARNASYTDLTLARRRLISLRSALSLDGDTRTRIDSIEKYTAAAKTDETPCGCKHDDNRFLCSARWSLCAELRRRTVHNSRIVCSVCRSSPSTSIEARLAIFRPMARS